METKHTGALHRVEFRKVDPDPVRNVLEEAGGAATGGWSFSTDPEA